MKKVFIFLILIQFSLFQYGQIIADHTVVEKFDDIPQYYIDQVKKMWLSYAGESHSEAIRVGLMNLESAYPAYAVNVTESGTPEAYTASHLRASRATWGDLTHATGWIYDYGEQDWFQTAPAIAQTKTGISYCYNNGLPISAIGFCWCWDVFMDYTTWANMYLSATDDYVAYSKANGIPTKVFYTTGPVDINIGEYGYVNH